VTAFRYEKSCIPQNRPTQRAPDGDKCGAPTIIGFLTEPWQAYVQAVEANGFASSNPQQLAECHYE
jgi:hypothetical protein